MRDKFYRLFRDNRGDPEVVRRFNYHQGVFRKLLKAKKKSYYNSQIIQNISNSKKIWSIANEVIYNRPLSESHYSVEIDGVLIDDSRTLADSFNKYFVGICNSRLPGFSPHPLPRLVPQEVTMLKFEKVTVQQVQNIIKSLKNTSAGYDAIKATLLKSNLQFFAETMTEVINNCFESGVFPDCLKINRVKPIPKTNSPSDLQHFRPISVPPVFTKIIEIEMKSQLVHYLKHNGLIDQDQYGFMEKSSTSSAALNLIDSVVRGLEDGFITAALFVDIRRAFDSMNFQQLEEELIACGVGGLALKLLKNYFDGRRQFVNVEEEFSETEGVEGGLPQGSNIPVIFLLYLNRVFQLSLHGRLIMYADDAVLIYRAKDEFTLLMQILEDLEKIYNFLLSLNMLINFQKTKFMVFKSKKVSFRSISFRGETIERVDVYEYLGLLVDCGLKFKQHAERVLKTVSRFLGLIYRLRHFLPTSTLLSLYFAHVQSHLLYLLPVWGASSANMTAKIQSVQSRVLKIIYQKPVLTRTNHLFKNVTDKNIIMFSQLVDFETILLVHKIYHRLIRIKRPVRTNEVISGRITRSSNLLRPAGYISSVGQNSVFHRGIVLYNRLPATLRNTTNITKFKTELRSTYIDSIRI